jgi:hypothetical protein
MKDWGMALFLTVAALLLGWLVARMIDRGEFRKEENKLKEHNRRTYGGTKDRTEHQSDR